MGFRRLGSGRVILLFVDIRPGLPPELQEVEIELQRVFEKGGIAACEAFIAQLATEADFAQVVVDETDLTIIEAEENMEAFPEMRQPALDHQRHLEQMRLEAGKVMARHAYALVRFHTLRKDST